MYLRRHCEFSNHPLIDLKQLQIPGYILQTVPGKWDCRGSFYGAQFEPSAIPGTKY